MTTARPLIGTYRLQLGPGFGFDDAAAVAPVLAELGVSHLYLSPCAEAVAGSTHGYDTVDPTRLRRELGGPAAFDRLVAAAHAHGLGLVADIVPNHLAADPANAWWWDVLRLGQASRYAQHFDIDWRPPESRLAGVVLLPVLGDHYGRVLEAGDLCLGRDGDELVARYFDHVAPLSPPTADELWAEAGRRAVVSGRPAEEALEDVLADRNAEPDAVDAVLDRQHFRFVRWQAAAHELDSRRFFDIDSLVALRSERLDVFADTHRLVTGLASTGAIDGIRVDHVDGLRDPGGYLERLRAAAPASWLVVEKILRPDEELPAWPVDGTSGYDGLARVGAVLVDPAGVDVLTAAWRRFSGEHRTYDAVRLEARREVLAGPLSADLERVVALLVRVCENRRRWRDFTRSELRDALQEVTVHLRAYRPYVRPGEDADDDAVGLVAGAVAAAADARPDLDADLLGLLRNVLLQADEAAHRAADGSVTLEAEVAARWQQLSGPVTAKGEEDTAFYRWGPLLSLNEVGTEPDHPDLDVADFHAASVEAQGRWPATMVTTSTHDTKRSEDVRARLTVLSEPDRATAFAAVVDRWSAMNAAHRDAGADAPDRGTEWFIYQTLVGAHPLPFERAWPAIEKSIREAKVRTSWVRPDAAYEAATQRFLQGALADPAFVADLEAFVAPLVEPGRVNALSQVALRLLGPGVPDTYQGTERWDLSLVDPDNRRSVDYVSLAHALAELPQRPAAALWADHQDGGGPKLALVRSCLSLRRRHQAAFAAADGYLPLEVTGAGAERVIAFARAAVGGPEVAAVVPRFAGRGLADGATVALPPGTWSNPMSGSEVFEGRARFGAARAGFPLALLERAGTPVEAGPSPATVR